MAQWQRLLWLVASVLSLLSLPDRAPAQRLGRAVLGGGLGVLGGAAITTAAVVARARFQNVYLHEPADLIHWQGAAMLAAPATGVVFGLRSRDALVGSVVGSVSGLAIGSLVGVTLGVLIADDPEGTWAGGAMGGGLGLAVGGLLGGILEWDDDGRDAGNGALRLELRLPLRAP